MNTDTIKAPHDGLFIKEIARSHQRKRALSKTGHNVQNVQNILDTGKGMHPSTPRSNDMTIIA